MLGGVKMGYFLTGKLGCAWVGVWHGAWVAGGVVGGGHNGHLFFTLIEMLT